MEDAPIHLLSERICRRSDGSGRRDEKILDVVGFDILNYGRNVNVDDKLHALVSFKATIALSC